MVMKCFVVSIIGLGVSVPFTSVKHYDTFEKMRIVFMQFMGIMGMHLTMKGKKMFENQVVWITGASSGIGEALALEMAAAGAKLVLSARRKEELERVAALAKERGCTEVFVLPLDVTNFDSHQGVMDSVLKKFGHIDVLINNAGIGQASLIVRTDMETYRKLFEVNFFSQIALTKTVLPHMLKRKSGHIAVTSSVSGKVGSASRAGYSATKHAILGWFDCLRVEGAQHGLKVTTIVPGYINTPISYSSLRGNGEPYKKVNEDNALGMDVTKCAKVVMKGFRKNKDEIAVGSGIEMWATTLRYWAPKLLFKLTEKRTPRYDV